MLGWGCMNTPSKTDFVYMAGLIDGEGSISINRAQCYGKYGMVSLSVSSTDRELLEWIKSVFGGCIVTHKKYKDNHSQSWTWRAKGPAAIAMLRGVRRYLKINRKKERTDLIVREWNKCTPRNGRYDANMLAKKFQLIEAILEIKPESGHYVKPGKKFVA
jgi:hypothetical protein